MIIYFSEIEMGWEGAGREESVQHLIKKGRNRQTKSLLKVSFQFDSFEFQLAYGKSS